MPTQDGFGGLAFCYAFCVCVYGLLFVCFLFSDPMIFLFFFSFLLAIFGFISSKVVCHLGSLLNSSWTGMERCFWKKMMLCNEIYSFFPLNRKDSRKITDRAYSWGYVISQTLTFKTFEGWL